MRPDARVTPVCTPSASAGGEASHFAALGVALPGGLADVARRRGLSPADAFHELRADPAAAALNPLSGTFRDDEVWNLVAWAWLKDVDPGMLARAEKLYTRDCAACHGPEGRGDGPAGRNLPGMAKMDPNIRSGPADFTDAGQMLSASDALLQGKLLRGGMGTGMPEFGSLYTDEELWAMITYLRTFLFKP
jgi:mono/diheme cytochrome c family protein